MGVFDQVVLNEVYFGKTKGLLEIENLINNIKSLYSGKTYFSNINASQKIEELNRKFEDYFGFKNFALYIQNSAITNAMTIPIGCRNDILSGNLISNYVVDKNGYKFKKEAGFSCIVYVYSGIFLNPEYSAAEVLAIILHEIGHNFSTIINGGIAFYQDIITYINLYILIFSSFSILFPYISNTNAVTKWTIGLNKSLNKTFPGIVKFFDSIDSAGGFLNDIGMNVLSLFTILTAGVVNVYSVIFSKLQKWLNLDFTGYTNEKIADNFASIYGYGPELTSALGKMESKGMGIVINKTINEIPILGTIINMTQLPSYILISAFDEHPIFIERCNDQIRILKKELQKNDLDPKMKKEILNNINEIERSMNKFTDTKEGIKDPLLAKKMFWGMMLKLSDGDMRHYVYGKNNPEDFDSAYKIKEVKMI